MEENLKQLLLKDLSARFPYGVVLDVDTTDWKAPQGHIQVKIEGIGIIFKDMTLIVNGCNYGDNYKPFLRSMSSMTEEEYHELGVLAHGCDCVLYYSACFPVKCNAKFKTYNLKVINWLLEHHFDFMGLIPKGLAVEVTEENNPYKE